MSTPGALCYPIQWHEGMLLMPQHFQQTDRRTEQWLHWQLKAAMPYPWGVLTYSIDHAALAGGIFRLLGFDAIMPDGLCVSLAENADGPLELDLSKYGSLFSVQKNLFIYITVPPYKPGASNVGADCDRFLSREEKSAVDENTGDNGYAFPTLRANLGLILSSAPPSSLTNMPIAEILYSGNTYHLTSYVPPVFHVAEKTFLYDQCQNVALKIREKFGFLTLRLSEGTAELMSYEGETAARALTSGLLPFEALIRSGSVSPFQLYLGAVSLASILSALDSKILPPVFDAYQHNNAAASFAPVFAYIDGLLDTIQEGYRIVPFDQNDRLFHLYCNHSWVQKRMILGAKAGVGMTEKDLMHWIQTTVICSERLVSSVRDRRILGVPRRLVSGDEEMKLLPARDVVLFAIEGESEFIQPDEVLHIFNVADTAEKRPAEIVLYMPNGPKNQNKKD